MSTSKTILFNIITLMKLEFSNYLGIAVAAFRGLLNESGCSFVVLSFQMQLQKIIPLSNFQQFVATTVTVLL